MDITEAREILEKIGLSYFYDETWRFSLEEIIKEIRGNILNARNGNGLKHFETYQNAIELAINNFSDEQLDGIILSEYGLFPNEVHGGRTFFKFFFNELNEAIHEKKKKMNAENKTQ